VGPSCLVALVLVEDLLVAVDSLCGYAARQAEAETGEEGPSVDSVGCGTVLVDQRGMVCQAQHCAVVAWYVST